MQLHSAAQGAECSGGTLTGKGGTSNPLGLALQYRGEDVVDPSHGIVSFMHNSDLVL